MSINSDIQEQMYAHRSEGVAENKNFDSKIKRIFMINIKYVNIFHQKNGNIYKYKLLKIICQYILDLLNWQPGVDKVLLV